MKTSVIIGAKGHGKSTQVKKLIHALKLPAYVYDVNAEYSNVPGVTSLFPSIDDFLKFAGNQRNCVIVFEEATIFFSNRGRSEQLINILVRARHNRVFPILCFHSLRAVPEYILELTEFIFLKRTADNPQTVIKKFGNYPEILSAFTEVQYHSQNDKYFTEEIRLMR